MEKEFVEIAGIKWATKNIGAEKETDIGLYFQWGDTQGYAADELGTGEDEKLFNWESYKYGNGSNIPSSINITKYNFADGKTVLEASDDAVIAAWGSSWRTPTKEEYIALFKSVNTKWTNDYKGSGIAGMICTDKIDHSKVLFFPQCGYCSNGSVYNVGSFCYYWSSSINSVFVYYAYNLCFRRGYVNWLDYSCRHFGYPVRGVMK